MVAVMPFPSVAVIVKEYDPAGVPFGTAILRLGPSAALPVGAAGALLILGLTFALNGPVTVQTSLPPSLESLQVLGHVTLNE